MELNTENSFKAFEHFWLHATLFCGKLLMIPNFFYRTNSVKRSHRTSYGWRDFGGGRHYKKTPGKE